MNCLLQLVALCVFAPSNVYVRTELNFAITDSHQTIGQWGEGEWCRTRWCSGPTGLIRLGVVAPVSNSLTFEYGVMHSSRINTDTDRGYESVFASVTWRPFR